MTGLSRMLPEKEFTLTVFGHTQNLTFREVCSSSKVVSLRAIVRTVKLTQAGIHLSGGVTTVDGLVGLLDACDAILNRVSVDRTSVQETKYNDNFDQIKSAIENKAVSLLPDFRVTKSLSKIGEYLRGVRVKDFETFSVDDYELSDEPEVKKVLSKVLEMVDTLRKYSGPKTAYYEEDVIQVEIRDLCEATSNRVSRQAKDHKTVFEQQLGAIDQSIESWYIEEKFEKFEKFRAQVQNQLEKVV